MQRLVPPDSRRDPVHGLRFARSSTDRVIAGVAGGLGESVGIDGQVIRLALVLLSLAGGFGVAVYAAMWLLCDPLPRHTDPHPVSGQRTLALACFVAAILLILRDIGLWPGDAVMIPAAIVLAGLALQSTGPRATRRRQPAADPFDQLFGGEVSFGRVAAGIVVAGGGLLALSAGRDLSTLPSAAAAVGIAAAGIVVVAGPLIGRVFNDAREAERERIRSEERAEMAAHLHDSVLQTLALMQRAAGDPRRMVLLARRQERELRTWLYSGDGPPRMLAEQLEGIAAEIELDHGVPVDLVLVGDHPVDEPVRALLAAVREAAVNAAKHASADAVTVYVEVRSSAVAAYVRDTGDGFDPSCVPPDRHGISASIRGRLARVGGHAVLDTERARGTEWELEVPA
jgi:signal transduction histidine kinase/phage shock protein PspC (stress-responsive transcriptional regulator)